MMGSMSDEEDQYFDTREDITSVSDSSSDCSESVDFDNRGIDSFPESIGYEIWINNPVSVQERRSKFVRWMGLNEGRMVIKDHDVTSCDGLELETDRITQCSGAVLGSLSSDDNLSLSQSSMSSWSNDSRVSVEGSLDERSVCKIRNLDDGTEFVVDELGQDGMLRSLRKVGSDALLTVEEFERSLGFSPLVQQLMHKGVEEAFNSDATRKQVKSRWLKKIGAAASIVDKLLAAGHTDWDGKARKVKVRSCKKQSKELSALYMRQDLPAHEGSILTMKFSPDGQYLASAGEDGIVRVWKVMESERSAQSDILDTDPSYAYFSMNNFSDVVPLNVDREKRDNLKTSGKTSVIFPQKVFQISEKPIHEFHGHSGEVLDLAWSKNKHLLSSSVDKTVRLWQLGCQDCLKVFIHNSYVTSIQFNPLDDDYFISGSVDGKVRMWAVSSCQVVNWTDISDIITAVCYRPDGKGVIAGSMSGICRFYNASDNRLQLYAQISLQGKKKSPLKRITGLQFSPTDPAKLMVTSADSQVRILDGVDVICKYRGLHNAGSQISASFTHDGTRIVSASEDSNVYVWNYRSKDGRSVQPKNHWSSERFFSNNTSVAIPWCSTSMTSRSSFTTTSASHPSPDHSASTHRNTEERGSKQSRFSSANHLSLSQGFFSDSISRGTATWPEDKLSLNSLVVLSSKCKSQPKFLKPFGHSTTTSCPQAWGLVIVTAGWDGRIRTFQNHGLPIRI
ncbi:uncharacterized protein LOC133797470 [Humulus lupulus]|uniref:uncharacterized protein LOC133797470 n=1 Tax=Humulus lupulus TaxID=3486 RepID=UPI002B40A7B5|nr:uncharacterized protein LOC133797470 [Humulus lupulus]